MHVDLQPVPPPGTMTDQLRAEHPHQLGQGESFPWRFKMEEKERGPYKLGSCQQPYFPPWDIGMQRRPIFRRKRRMKKMRGKTGREETKSTGCNLF